MRARDWRHVLVVSDPPHIRRVNWSWGKIFKATGLRYTIVQSQPSWWDTDAWWRNDHATKFVHREYRALLYYKIAEKLGMMAVSNNVKRDWGYIKP